MSERWAQLRIAGELVNTIPLAEKDCWKRRIMRITFLILNNP